MKCFENKCFHSQQDSAIQRLSLWPRNTPIETHVLMFCSPLCCACLRAVQRIGNSAKLCLMGRKKNQLLVCPIRLTRASTELLCRRAQQTAAKWNWSDKRQIFFGECAEPIFMWRWFVFLFLPCANSKIQFVVNSSWAHSYCSSARMRLKAKKITKHRTQSSNILKSAFFEVDLQTQPKRPFFQTNTLRRCMERNGSAREEPKKLLFMKELLHKARLSSTATEPHRLPAVSLYFAIFWRYEIAFLTKLHWYTSPSTMQVLKAASEKIKHAVGCSGHRMILWGDAMSICNEPNASQDHNRKSITSTYVHLQ